MKRCLWLAPIAAFSCCAAGRSAPAPEPAASAAWELRLLGLANDTKLAELRDFPKQRRVKLGIVGQGGVSQEQLRNSSLLIWISSKVLD